MRWLLDTDVSSELRRGDRAHPGVRAWVVRAAEDAVFTSVLVVGELRRGAHLRRLRDPATANVLDAWIDRMVATYGDRILPVDRAVAARWGSLGIPDRVPAVDGLIAATALVHDLTLVTRHVRDMERTGVRILDPFTTG